MIERAVILARGGAIQFDLPIDEAPLTGSAGEHRDETGAKAEFLTEVEMRQYERENLMAVLGRTDWKIKGVDGAAELLGVKPTTLLSRIKSLGLKRPER